MNGLRIAVGISALALVVLGVVVALEIVTPPEERIRQRIEETAEAFDEGEVSAVVAAFAEDWRDSSAGIDREQLRLALLGDVLRRARDPSRRWHAAVEPDRIEVELQGERDARVRFSVRLLRLEQPAPQLVWAVRIEAEMSEDPREGWRFVRSSYRTTAGSVPR